MLLISKMTQCNTLLTIKNSGDSDVFVTQTNITESDPISNEWLDLKAGDTREMCDILDSAIHLYFKCGDSDTVIWKGLIPSEGNITYDSNANLLRYDGEILPQSKCVIVEKYKENAKNIKNGWWKLFIYLILIIGLISLTIYYF